MGSNIKISDEDILSQLNQDIRDADSLQEELASQRETFYKQYRMEPYGNEISGWSSSVAPIIFNNMHGNLPSLMEIFDEDFFVLRGDNDDRSKKLQKLLYVQMFHKQDGYRKMYDFLYNAWLYHYGVIKVYKKEEYDLETLTFDRLSEQEMQALQASGDVQVSKYEDVGQLDVNTGQEITWYENIKAVRRKMIFSGPFFEVVPNWEFKFTRDAKIGDFGAIDARLVCHEVRRSLDYIRKKEKAGIYRPGSYDKVKEKVESRQGSEKVDEDTILNLVDSITTTSDKVPEENEPAKDVVIEECYYKMDIDGDGLLEHCLVDICDDIILQVRENPYNRPPFRVGSIIPEPNKVIGIAMPKILENDQKVMTNLLRLIQDSAAVATYRNPVTNDPQLFSNLQVRKPFSVILGNPEKLGEVKSSDPSPFILKAWEMMKRENEEKTGTTRYNQGLDADSLNKTATGISLIAQAATKRLRLIAKLLGKGPIKGLIKDFIYINQKWPAPQEQMRILGSKLEIKRDDLYGDYDIEIDIGVGPAEKQAAANQLDLLIQWQMQAGLNIGVCTPVHVLRAQRKKYRLLNVAVDDLLMTEEEFTKEQERKAREPKKPLIKEVVDVDRLYPLLSRMEQMQVLQLIGIQPDPNAKATGLPNAQSLLKSEQEKANLQADMMKFNAQQQFDIMSKMHDAKESKADRKVEFLSTLADQKVEFLGKLMDYHATKREQQNQLAMAHLKNNQSAEAQKGK